MKNFSLAILLLLLSSTVNASEVFGNWQGKGIAVNTQGSVNCESIRVSINAVPAESIAINKISWKCGGFKFTSKKQILSVVDGVLYANGIENPVGTLNENSLTLDVVDSGLSYAVILAVSEGKLALVKRVTSNKNGESLAVGGSLTPVN